MELFLLVDIVNKVNRLSDLGIEIGTVEDSDPGDPAGATLTGEFPNYELNLTLPRGEAGPEGPQGGDGDIHGGSL